MIDISALSRCFAKQVFATKGEALTVLRIRKKRRQASVCKKDTDRRPLRAYHCHVCGGWHLGQELRPKRGKK